MSCAILMFGFSGESSTQALVTKPVFFVGEMLLVIFSINEFFSLTKEKKMAIFFSGSDAGLLGKCH